jgi:hypothetical protein
MRKRDVDNFACLYSSMACYIEKLASEGQQDAETLHGVKCKTSLGIDQSGLSVDR